MDAFTYIEPIAQQWRIAVAAVVATFILYWIVVFALKLFAHRYLKQRDMVWIEFTPPASIEKTPEATEQLFSVLHGAHSARHIKDRMLNRVPVTAFEIVSTRRDGIRYLIQVERCRSKSIQKAITAYVPDSKVAETEREETTFNDVIEFKETAHYVLPLTLTSAFEQHDPLSYVTGAMTKLTDNEQITLQLVVQPVRLREANMLSHRILGNENILEQVSSKHFSLLGRTSKILSRATSGMTDFTSEVYMGTTYGHKNHYDSMSKQKQIPATRHDRPSRTLSAFELELMETMHKKVTKPLFQVNLRILIKSGEAKEHVTTLKSALDGFSVPPYQSLKAKLRLPILNERTQKLAVDRLPSMLRRNSLILSAPELASFYHVPSSRVSKTDNLITSLSRTLPAPISLKQNQNFDVILGRNYHHGTETDIGLTMRERERHVYIIGGTGNGKTTLLQYAIVQDMQNGKGLAVVDPHGDMAETLLRYLPEHRINDVVYFNPDDIGYPIGLNLLELPEGVTGDELIREKDLITESVVSVFRKIFSEEDTGGHRIEYVLRNTVQTALTVSDATLFTVFKLLNDPKYRKSVTNTLEDEDLKNFWKHELGKAGDMQKVKMAAGITSKIGRFLFSASAKRILEQPKSTVDFDDVINSGKILICNFSKGLIGEDTSELFGITVLAKLQLASLRRARVQQSERRPFFLYVDEFQNFATASFVQMLSESRKYKLFLTMAEQSTSQQKDQQMVQIILANVGTVLSFRTGSPQDERMLLPLFGTYIGQGEINSLPAFSFYARLSAVHSQEPLSGQTLLIEDAQDEKVATLAIKLSRANFARQQTEHKEMIVSEVSSQTRGKPQTRQVIKSARMLDL